MANVVSQDSPVVIIIQVLGSIAIVFILQYATALSPPLKKTIIENSPTRNYRSRKLQSRRRIQHITTGISFYFISLVLSRSLCSLLLLLVIILFYLLHHTAIHRGGNNKSMIQTWYRTTFASLLRPEELSTNKLILPGAWYFLVGTLFLSVFPPLDIARTSLLCLSFADPAAAIGGIFLNQHDQPLRNTWYKTKTIGGSLCCFSVTFLIVIIHQHNCDWREAIITALSCSIVEGLFCRIPILDDNLMIPVGTAITLWSYRSLTLK